MRGCAMLVLVGHLPAERAAYHEMLSSERRLPRLGDVAGGSFSRSL